MIEGQEMSLDELKSEMFTSLRDSGAVDSIKAQIRSQFLRKLQGYSKDCTLQEKGEWTVHERIIGSLFIDYLTHYGFQQTRSVFLPESHLHQCVFSRENILEALNFDKESAMFKQMIQPTPEIGNQEVQEPLVLTLIREVCDQWNQKKEEIGTQTVMQSQDHRHMLDEQLRRVESIYLHQTAEQREAPCRTIEERMLKYQRECDELSSRMIEQQMEQFKENEITKVRLEEQRKFQKQLDGLRAQVHADYESQVRSLKEKEQACEIEYMRRKTELEAELYEQRQRVLLEVDSLRAREEEIRRKEDLDFRKLSTDEARLKDLEQRIALREKSIDSFEENLKQKHTKLVEEAKKAILTSYSDREAAIVKAETKLKKELEEAIREKHQASEQSRKCNDLQQKLEVAFKTETQLVDQNNALIAEREQLRERIKALQKELDRSNEALRDANKGVAPLQVMIDQLEADLKRTTADNSRLTMVLQTAQEDLQAYKSKAVDASTSDVENLSRAVLAERRKLQEKESEWWAERRALQQKILDAESMSQRYQRKSEDDEIEAEALRREVTSLREMLTQAQTAMTIIERPSLDIDRRRVSSFRSSYVEPLTPKPFEMELDTSKNDEELKKMKERLDQAETKAKELEEKRLEEERKRQEAAVEEMAVKQQKMQEALLEQQRDFERKQRLIDEDMRAERERRDRERQEAERRQEAEENEKRRKREEEERDTQRRHEEWLRSMREKELEEMKAIELRRKELQEAQQKEEERLRIERAEDLRRKLQKAEEKLVVQEDIVVPDEPEPVVVETIVVEEPPVSTPVVEEEVPVEEAPIVVVNAEPDEPDDVPAVSEEEQKKQQDQDLIETYRQRALERRRQANMDTTTRSTTSSSKSSLGRAYSRGLTLDSSSSSEEQDEATSDNVSIGQDSTESGNDFF